MEEIKSTTGGEKGLLNLSWLFFFIVSFMGTFEENKKRKKTKKKQGENEEKLPHHLCMYILEENSSQFYPTSFLFPIIFLDIIFLRSSCLHFPLHVSWKSSPNFIARHMQRLIIALRKRSKMMSLNVFKTYLWETLSNHFVPTTWHIIMSSTQRHGVRKVEVTTWKAESERKNDE